MTYSQCNENCRVSSLAPLHALFRDFIIVTAFLWQFVRLYYTAELSVWLISSLHFQFSMHVLCRLFVFNYWLSLIYRLVLARCWKIVCTKRFRFAAFLKCPVSSFWWISLCFSLRLGCSTSVLPPPDNYPAVITALSLWTWFTIAYLLARQLLLSLSALYFSHNITHIENITANVSHWILQMSCLLILLKLSFSSLVYHNNSANSII